MIIIKKYTDYLIHKTRTVETKLKLKTTNESISIIILGNRWSFF